MSSTAEIRQLLNFSLKDADTILKRLPGRKTFASIRLRVSSQRIQLSNVPSSVFLSWSFPIFVPAFVSPIENIATSYITSVLNIIFPLLCYTPEIYFSANILSSPQLVFISVYNFIFISPDE